jgi:hypothetical protein
MGWFDATQIDPATAQSQFPIGRHPVIIKSSASLAVKDKPNEGLLALTCEIIDGPSKGVTGVYRLNLWNSNPQAAEIASKQLSAICHVTGVYQLNDTVNRCSELFGKPFCVIVSAQQADARYTQVDGVTDMAGNPPAKGNVPSQAAPHPQAAAAAQGWQQAAPSQAQPPQGGPSWQQPPAQAQPNNPAPAWAQQPNNPSPAWAR